MMNVQAREQQVQIVGIEHTDKNEDTGGVETIDVWYSARRDRWIVERLDADGNQLGVAYRCDSEAEAAACLLEWLRAHGETHLVAPRDTTPAERRILAGRPRRRAA